MVFYPNFSEAKYFKSRILSENGQLSNNLEGEVKAGIKHQPNFNDSDHGPLFRRDKSFLILLLLKRLLAKLLSFCDHRQLLSIFLDQLS